MNANSFSPFKELSPTLRLIAELTLLVTATAALALWSATAMAGSQYVDETGFAASGYDVVAYRSLEQSSIGQSQPNAIPGSKQFTAEWNGATWAFSSAENLAAFKKDPAKFAPAYDGHCAYGASLNGKVPANPHLWRIVDGQLYLNITTKIVEFWEADVPGNIVKAENNWTALEAKPASNGPIPQFKSKAPN